MDSDGLTLYDIRLPRPAIREKSEVDGGEMVGLNLDLRGGNDKTKAEQKNGNCMVKDKQWTAIDLPYKTYAYPDQRSDRKAR